MRLLARFIERPRREIVRFGADPRFLAAMLAADSEHGVEHPSRDALSLEGRRHADLVDIELGDLVGVAVDDGGALGHHDFVNYRHDHEMARRGEIGSEALGADGLVEDFVGEAHHKGVIAGM
jgi:hypothetical protein